MTQAKIKTKPEMNILKEEEIPHLLVPGEVGAVLEFTVRDKKGNVTQHQVMKSRSFVRQFLELLWVQATQIPEIKCYSIKDWANFTRDVPASGYVFASDALANDHSYGIIVGTGTTAPTINDYVVEAKISHGTGAGQLQYSAVSFGAPASDATTSQFTITRDFANASGGAITVNEIALYVKGYRYDSTYHFMTIRDVISGGILVPDGQTLTVNYRPQATV